MTEINGTIWRHIPNHLQPEPLPQPQYHRLPRQRHVEVVRCRAEVGSRRRAGAAAAGELVLPSPPHRHEQRGRVSHLLAPQQDGEAERDEVRA